jgi:hypothetical protein
MFVFIYISNVNCFVFLVVDVKKSLQNPEIEIIIILFIVLALRNNPQVDMSLHSGTYLKCK